MNFVLDPAIIVDLNGNLIAANYRLLETNGFRRDELEGANVLRTDLVSSNSRILLFRKCLETAATTDVSNFEVELNKKNGERIIAEAKMKKIDFGKKNMKLIVFHDITDMRNREKVLKESEEMYANYCEDDRILIFLSDLKGNICFVNEVAKTYGFIREDVFGKNMVDFISKKNCQKFVSNHLCVVSGKKVKEEIEIVTSKGIFFVEYISAPLRKDGRITGCYFAMRDVTEKKEASQKIEKYFVSADEFREAYG